jgi:hypothetical protein
MAESLNIETVRNYPLSTGENANLVALLSTDVPADWAPATEAHPVGTVVYTHAMGTWRRGVVVKVTKTKMHVAITTQGAVDEAVRYGHGVRVQTTAATFNWVMVAPAPAAPVQEAEETELEEFTAEERAAGDEAFRACGALDDAHSEALAEDSYRESEAALAAQAAEHAEWVATITARVETPAEVDEMHPECEVKGCDLPEGALECRRCGAELLVIEDDDLTLNSQDGKVDNMTETSTAKHTGSTVVALIERVWDRIRADHPELPEVVVTTGSGEGVKWGHFRPESWKLEGAEGRRHEFFLSSEALAKGANQVLQTTIHEAAHTLSKARGIQDTSRQGRWHNAAFRKAAEELGLEHKGSKADSSHGFSFVTLTEATKVRYADLLAELNSELKLTGLLPAWLGGDDQGGEKITGKPKGEDEGKAKSGNLKATCGCEEPIIVRLSQKVLDLGVVRCDDCGDLFTAST